MFYEVMGRSCLEHQFNLAKLEVQTGQIYLQLKCMSFVVKFSVTLA